MPHVIQSSHIHLLLRHLQSSFSLASVLLGYKLFIRTVENVFIVILCPRKCTSAAALPKEKGIN